MSRIKDLAVDRHVGGRIRVARIMAGLSQERLAEMLGVAGAQIGKYEAGTNSLSIPALLRIARALEVPVVHFVAELDDEPATAARQRRPFARVVATYNAMTRKQRLLWMALGRSLVEARERKEDTDATNR